MIIFVFYRLVLRGELPRGIPTPGTIPGPLALQYNRASCGNFAEAKDLAIFSKMTAPCRY